MSVMSSIWRNLVIIQEGGKINKFSFLSCYSRNGKCKYMTHSIITEFIAVYEQFFLFFSFAGVKLLNMLI